MGVVTKYGTAYKDPASVRAAEAVRAEGRVMAINSRVDIANGDSIASTYFIGRVPSNAILMKSSRGDTAAITGAAGNIGFAGALAALAAAQSLATLATFDPLAAVAAANMNKQAWDLAGFTSDPGGVLDLLLTLTAAATAAGSVNFCITYARK